MNAIPFHPPVPGESNCTVTQLIMVIAHVLVGMMISMILGGLGGLS